MKKRNIFLTASIILFLASGSVLRAEVTMSPEKLKDLQVKPWLPKSTATFSASLPARVETPEVPHVTIETTSCRYAEEEPTASEYVDYKESRYCRLPLPEGAVVTRITAFMVSDEREDSAAFVDRLLDNGNSSAKFIVVPEHVVDDHYVTGAVVCTSGGTNPGFMAIHERKKTFDCRVGIPVDQDSSFYVRIESRVKARPEFRDVVMTSKHIIFPIVRLIQVEYEGGS
ncbi:MAG TPA: hypothetical protein VLJ37_06250 [bacterium]|nr:hypothetical protein [bacterium]